MTAPAHSAQTAPQGRVVRMVLDEETVTRLLGDLDTIRGIVERRLNGVPLVDEVTRCQFTAIGGCVNNVRKYLSDPTWGLKRR